MKRILFTGIVISIMFLAGVSYAGLGQILFADQDMPVGYCGVYPMMPNPAPWQVCVGCSMMQFDSLIDGAWCGVEVKWDTGVETATGMVVTVTQTKNYNPIPGKFPYKGPFVNGGLLENFNECHTTFSDCAPAADACVSGESGPIAVAVHADIHKEDMTETAWVAECLQYGPDGMFGCQEWGTDFAGANWATYVHIPCYTGESGICASGLLSCVGDAVENAGGVVCQRIQEPQAEICDGLDNDCNEGTPDGSGEQAPLNTNQTGVCNGSVQACSVGTWIDDYSGVPGYEDAVEASCGDGLDNDCDGDTDCNDSDCPACSNSCEGYCGGVAPSGCWCDEDCVDIGNLDIGNCCEDACDACGYNCPG